MAVLADLSQTGYLETIAMYPLTVLEAEFRNQGVNSPTLPPKAPGRILPCL